MANKSNIDAMGNRIVQKGFSQLASSIATKAREVVSTRKNIEELRIGVRVEDTPVLEKKIKDRDIVFIDSFPSNLRKFYMRMDFSEYKRPSPEVVGELNQTYAVCFPIPTNLGDQYDVEYGSFDASIAGMILNSFSPDGNRGVTAGAIKPVVDIARQFGGEGIVNIISQDLKASINPLKSVIFKSPEFKKYNFSWNFAPETEQESAILRKIIRNIKARALPTYAKSADGKSDYNIFNFPNMVKVSFYPWAKEGNKENNELFQTKQCVIENISINYSPENNLSFFNDSANSPAFVSLSVSLREIEMFTGGDFGRNGSEVVVIDAIGKTVEEATQNSEIFEIFNPKPPIEQ